MGGRLVRVGRGVLAGRSPMLAAVQSVGAEVVVLALNVLTGMITARLLGPEGRGVFAAVTLWHQLVATVAISGLGSAVIYHSRRPGLDPGGVAAAAAVAALLSTSAAALLAAIAIPPMMATYPGWATTAALACLAVAPLNALHMIFKQSLAARGAYRLFNLASIASPALFLLALAAATLGWGLTPALAIAALAGAAALNAAWLAPVWRHVVRPRVDRLGETWRRMAGYVWQSAGADLVLALSFSVDRLFLIPLVSGEALGLYVVAYSFSRLLLVLRPAIDAVVFPSMADRAPAEMKILHDRAFRIALVVLVAALVPLFALDRALLGLLYGGAFAQAAPLFRILAVEAALGLLGGITMRYALARGLPTLASGVQVGGLAASAGLMVWLVPLYGVEGAALSAAVAAGLRLAALVAALAALGHGLPQVVPRPADLRFVLDRLT